MEHIVYLVGAGPGDPDLLTVKALKIIQSADIVVYDRLVSEEIMALVPRGVPRVYAGKSCKQKTMPQEEINVMLADLSQKYQSVVRIKGGDPFLFGRGGEEALALKARNIVCEVIPGITSAQGCAASVGIPLTHRGLATGVRFITGHRMSVNEKGEQLELNWQSLADEETTIVVYMGLVNLEIIIKRLTDHGLPATIPAAIIERGTTPQQRVFRCTLADLKKTVDTHQVESPSLVVIGKVAALDVSVLPSDIPQSQTSARQ